MENIEDMDLVVPELQPALEKIVDLTDEFCCEHLNESRPYDRAIGGASARVVLCEPARDDQSRH